MEKRVRSIASFGLLSDFGIRNSDLQCLFDELQQLAVSLDRLELPELLFDVLRRPKQEAHTCLLEHRGVVVGIAGGNDVVVQTFQRRDCLLLLVVDAQLVIDDSVVDNLQLVTEQRGPFQLLQQRSGKFLKSIGKDDDLGDRTQSAQKFQRAVQRTQAADDSLNVGQFQS